MHSHDGRLLGTRTTGQQLCLELSLPNGLNPSAVIVNLMFQESDLMCLYLESISFHAAESAKCRNAPSFMRSSSCHLNAIAVSLCIKSLLSLDLIGKYRSTFFGIAFFFPCQLAWFYQVCFSTLMLHILSKSHP